MTRRAEVYKLNTISKHFFFSSYAMFFHQICHNMLPDPEKIKLYDEATKNTNIYFPETKQSSRHAIDNFS